MPKLEDELRGRAQNLFSFLMELTQLRLRTIRSIDQYEDVLWLHEIPKESGCDCFIWRGDEPQKTSVELLRITKPKFQNPPLVPTILESWIDQLQINDSSIDSPQLHQQIIIKNTVKNINSTFESQTITLKLIDHPEIKSHWEQYLKNKWIPWAEKDRRHQKLQTVYSQLFSIYQKQQKLGEEFEVIVGIGLLTWKTPNGQEIKRHLITMRVNLNFNSERGIFTVESIPESSQFVLEMDMLEPEEQPPIMELRPIEQRLQELSGDVWDHIELNKILECWVNAVQSRGIYSDNLIPASAVHEIPKVTFAPAIILRKRSESSLRLFFQTIIKQIQNTDTLPQGIIQIISDLNKNGSEFENPEIKNYDRLDDKEIYFPLPVNDEQKSILFQLNKSHGTVVQGPPGTGKSHTIANLVCHLLAEGKKVLITSHTARALQVLVNKIPENVSGLCVLLLGNDRAAKDSLNDSVSKILHEYHRWTPKKNIEKINSLKSDLDILHCEEAKLLNQLTILREAETKSYQLQFGSYKGTLSQIAKQLNNESGNFNWFLTNQVIDQSPPLTNLELIHLLRIFRQINRLEKSDEIKLSTYLEKIGNLKLITPEEFNVSVRKEKEISERVNEFLQIKNHPWYLQLSKQSIEFLEEFSIDLKNFIKNLEKFNEVPYSWCSDAIKQVINGQDRLWNQLYDVTERHLKIISSKVNEISEWQVSGFGRRDPATVKRHAEDLLHHFSYGGKLGLGPFKARPVKDGYYLIKEIRVNGQLCDNPSSLSKLIDILDLNEHFNNLKNAWREYAKPPQGSFLIQRTFFEDLHNALQNILDFRHVYDSLTKKASTIKEFQQPEWHNLNQLYQLKLIIEAIILEMDFKDAQLVFQKMETQLHENLFEINELKSMAGKILDVIKRRDDIEYQASYKKVEDIRLKIKEKIGIIKYGLELYDRFHNACPQIAEQLQSSFDDTCWDERLTNFEAAWNWYRANQWLKDLIKPNEYERLNELLNQKRERIHELVAELAAALAWQNCISKMTDIERAHLEAWRQAIAKLGKGTGKYANKYRRDAQYNLERCRFVIPAWIMPIYRIVETVNPEKEIFDVAIIDEASQSGPEVLFLEYISKKILVVGDDKQISPDNVGITKESVGLLRKKWITTIPFAEFIGIDYSYFDYTSIRFGNVIRLREHFRCMSEIIQFSNNLCYSSDPLIPLRQYGSSRISPVVVTRYIDDGYQKGKSPRIINHPEAQAIVDQIKNCCDDPVYKNKTFGMISLLGHDQARYIERLLLERVGPEEMEKRQLICGDAYAFQGDERDVIFLSLVSAPTEGYIIGTLANERDERRFNVAASRAKDQIWLFHSATLNDLSPKCLRYHLLEYCLNPIVKPISISEERMKELIKIALNRNRNKPDPPFESWFEADVFFHIVKKGYHVITQYEIAGYRIDLLIVGIKSRLAVECDGDSWHGMDRYEEDMARQRMLERCGLTFWRIRGSDFYRDPEESLSSLWNILNEMQIHPG